MNVLPADEFAPQDETVQSQLGRYYLATARVRLCTRIRIYVAYVSVGICMYRCIYVCILWLGKIKFAN